MRTHVQFKALQGAALRVLWCIAVTGSMDAKERIEKCGGVELILQAMTIHSTCSRTVHAALAALGRFANNRRTNKTRIRGGAIPAIVTAMVRMDES
jgi:hypothetical protein